MIVRELAVAIGAAVEEGAVHPADGFRIRGGPTISADVSGDSAHTNDGSTHADRALGDVPLVTGTGIPPAGTMRGGGVNRRTTPFPPLVLDENYINRG
ncbi:MAG: hypothetical protein AMXMBFR58_15510 [Phycisphaerae bacterium]